MSKDNKAIVKKFQSFLKEFGYEVKISHLYEVFSKVNGVKDWNTAKSTQKEFSDIIPAQEIKYEPGSILYVSSTKDLLIPKGLLNDSNYDYVSFIDNSETLKQTVIFLEKEMIRRESLGESVKELGKFVLVWDQKEKFESVFNDKNWQPKLINIMRKGRASGIFLVVPTSKAVKSDVPPEIQTKFVQKMIFKVETKD